MALRLLLDTNAYSALGRGHPKVGGWVRGARELVFSSVVVGELMAGFRLGSMLPENVGALRRFLASPRVTLLPVSWTTADRYSRLFAALKTRGTPIPTNDLWIAAHALEAGAELVSFDRHFGSIDGLAWVDPGGDE